MQTPSFDKLKPSLFTTHSKDFFLDSKDKNIFSTPSIFGNYLSSFKCWTGSNSSARKYIINTNEMNKENLDENYKSSQQKILKLDVKKSQYQMSNVNININLSYLDESTAEKEKSYSKSGTEVKKNLSNMFRDDTEDNDLIKLISNKKKKYFEKVKDEEDDYDIDEKLNYIFEKERPVKVSNICRCNKTACSKYYCNCLRNGAKCKFSCSCTNCLNNGSEKKFLNKKVFKK
jgi:hypothetical protein